MALEFLKASSGVPMYGTIRGFIFEKLAHSRLSKGGQFFSKQYNGEKSRITIGEREYHQFSNNFVPDKYCVPSSKTFPTVDSIVDSIVPLVPLVYIR